MRSASARQASVSALILGVGASAPGRVGVERAGAVDHPGDQGVVAAACAGVQPLLELGVAVALVGALKRLPRLAEPVGERQQGQPTPGAAVGLVDHRPVVARGERECDAVKVMLSR